MSTLKNLAFTGIIAIALTLALAFGLTFVMPDVQFTTLIALSFGILAVLYFIFKLTSAILKIAIFAILIAGIVYFFMRM